MSPINAVLSALLFVSLSSCDLQELVRPSASGSKPDLQSKAAAEPTGSKMMSPGEKLAFHKWMVMEMQQQIFARPTGARDDVAAWANVLSQRASIEGVYHGFVLSTQYLEMEKSNRAPSAALRFFSTEMAAMDFPFDSEGDPKIVQARERYSKEHINSSLFTLKRVLGDRVIADSKKRKDDIDGLATWYASFASRWAKLGVDFGMEQRNRDDSAFHFKWAKENNLGLVQWELLNRVHRVLNGLGGLKVPSSQEKSK
jgi:hypothetical protein